MTPVTPILGEGDVLPQTYNELATAVTTSARKRMEALIAEA
jgi:hypothetical protein